MTESSSPDVGARLDAIEHRLDVLERRRELLVGWREIAEAVRKSPGTVRRWTKAGFPALRVGRHRVSTMRLIEAWFLQREEWRETGTVPRFSDMLRARKVQKGLATSSGVQ